MDKNVKIVKFFLFFVGLFFVVAGVGRVQAGEIKLPEKKEQIYAISSAEEDRNLREYWVKIKLRMKKDKVCWRNRRKVRNMPLFKIDKRTFRLKDFKWKEEELLGGSVLKKKLKITKGKHEYEKLDNATFDVEWCIIEPDACRQIPAARREPEITFRKVNPTKYEVKVEGAKGPFWLVFSESFHKEWKIYKLQTSNFKLQTSKIIADYPKLGVKEAEHITRFTLEDIKSLFKKPLDAEHHLVNGYANGWYIDPKKLGLSEEFTLTIYFWPQSLFYLGLLISGLTFVGCTGYLGIDYFKRRKRCKDEL